MPRTRSSAGDPLATYRQMRDFSSTPEPRGRRSRKGGDRFLIQKHAARRLHYDLRLELDGVLKSWAVTRGPSLDPADKRLAVRTEDHPIEYGDFEGVIPEGYGAGTVMLWDTGTWQPKDADPAAALERGTLKFTISGQRLHGGYVLVRMKPRGNEKRENWLLIKERDEFVDADRDPTEEWTDSVTTGREFGGIEADERQGESMRPAAGKSKARRRTRSELPSFVEPQLATLRSAPPDGEHWLHEIKYDGYRLEALVGGGEVRLMTRNRQDWTSRYPSVAQALAELDVEEAVLDGEVVALDPSGRSNFGALQKSADRNAAPLLYYAFDLLALNGRDLRREPLIERKKRLRALLGQRADPVRYSDHVEESGTAVIERACRLGLEGIVSKRADRPYRSGRGTDWIKSKCVGRDEFVIGGYRESDKRGRPFASLLLGEYVDGRLVYRGRVGTGFDAKTTGELGRRLEALRQADPPFAGIPAAARRNAVWTRPELVAQIAYTEKTTDGLLRHPSFQGLREDKPARDVQGATVKGDANGSGTLCGVRMTSPDKVLYREVGLTKRELAQYYLDVADAMLPHLAGRPVSLVRCPTGRTGKCFFQKHFNESTPPQLKCVRVEEKGGKPKPYLLIDDRPGLVAAAQMGVLELHVWGARADRIERPERIVFDLDPAEDVPFTRVRDAAAELKDLLEAAGLTTFALLTGGKGVHVIAPLKRRNSWPEVKGFARNIAEGVARAAPRRYIATASKARRKGKVFIDWLRNERGATAVVPFAARAREGAPVAVPVTWQELARIDSAAAYDVHTVRRRLAALKKDPWAGYFEVNQSLTRAMLERAEAVVAR